MIDFDKLTVEENVIETEEIKLGKMKMNKEKETAYCPNCRKETVFEIKQIPVYEAKDCIGVSEYYFCSECNSLDKDSLNDEK